MTSTPAPTWAWGLAGTTSAAAGLAVGHVVAGLLGPEMSPIVAVGSTVIDAVPTSVKEWAIATFGTADKAVLVTGVLLVVLIAAWGLGVLSRHRLRGSLAAVGGLSLVAGWCAVTDQGTRGWIPAFVTGAVGAGLLVGQRRLLDHPVGSPSDPGGGSGPLAGAHGAPPAASWMNRRRFIAGSTGLAGGAVVLGGAGTALTRSPTPVVDIPGPARSLPALPAGLERATPQITAFRTPTDDFYRIDISLVPPRIAAEKWTLQIDGLVDAPYSVTMAQLLAMTQVEHDITLSCVSNEVGGDLVGGARWQGVAVADLLRRARPRRGADMVLSASADGFTASTPLDVLLDGRAALVAVGMNGQPLPVAHGAPARLITPGLYGFVGATKWLTKLTVTTFADHKAYWTVRGWSDHGPVKTASRIDTPRSGATVRAGSVVVGGVAWAPHRGIKGVQLRIDDGPWLTAALGPSAGVDYWRQWMLRWDATVGRHQLTVRAIDGSGESQTDQVAGGFPDGATGWHQVEVTVS